MARQWRRWQDCHRQNGFQTARMKTSIRAGFATTLAIREISVGMPRVPTPAGVVKPSAIRDMPDKENSR
jgi:hypothetical protein